MQRKFIKKGFDDGLNVKEIKIKLDEQFGKSALCTKSVYNWYNSFKLGFESIEDDERSGRPHDEQLSIQISHILEEEPYASIRYIAGKVGSNPATVYRHVTIYLSRIYMHSKYVPHNLNALQKVERVEKCTQLLNILSQSKEINFINILTGDESWFYIKYNPKGAWIISGESPPCFENKGFQIVKFMLTVIWGVNGFHVIDLMNSGLSFNSSYFISHILCEIEQLKLQKTVKRKKIQYFLHLDNSHVHNSKDSQEKIANIGFLRAPHPSYSPDVAPSDFYLFGYVKNRLEGQEFRSPDELLDAVIEIIEQIPKETIIRVFEEWMNRCQKVIDSKGEYCC